MSASLTRTEEELAAALADFERLRWRGVYNRVLSRLPRAASYLVRTVDRVLVLGRVLGAQARVNTALRDGQAQTRAELERIELQLQQITDLQNALRQQSAQLAVLSKQVAMIVEEVAKQEQLSRQNDVIGRVQRSYAELEARHRRSVGELRVLQQHVESNVRGDGGISQPSIDDIDIRWLLQNIEQDFPELQTRRSVELSIQDSMGEVALAGGVSYLGERMASRGETYRMPNDLWYHIDFSPAWNRQTLFESAHARLAKGGTFVLVTSVDNTTEGSIEGLEQVYTSKLNLISGKNVRIFAWRKL